MASTGVIGKRISSGKAVDILYRLKDLNDAKEASTADAIANFDKISESFFKSHSDFIAAAEK